MTSDYHYNLEDQYLGTLSKTGGVWVFYGSSAGITATQESDADWAFFGNSDSEVGIQLESVDVNGDGLDDLIVTNHSASYLFYGPLSMPTDSYGSPRAATLQDADATFGVGGGVSTAGDQNQDGYEDILIGKETIYLFFGAPN